MLADVNKSLSIAGANGTQINTHFYGKHVDDCHQDQKQGNPHRRIDILPDYPTQERLAIVVTKFDSICDCDQLVGGKDGIGKPLRSQEDF
jgi:hypothetical protein